MSIYQPIRTVLDKLEGSTRLRSTPTGRWIFEPHVNTEFGETRVYSRFRGYVIDMLAVSIVRFPIDLLIWSTLFCLGFALGSWITGH